MTDLLVEAWQDDLVRVAILLGVLYWAIASIAVALMVGLTGR